ncbi:MAG TPA: protein kinase [Vicinamibacterales bacterium]
MAHPDSPTLPGGPAEEGRFDARAGPYRLISELGHGGMGTVYLAVRDDDAFQKRVAIKILKRGMDTDAIVRRFRHERQILASLQHPYIASLLDGGTTADGRPYFAMEYVQGQPIVDYCETHRLDTSARLELFRKVCAAVQHAHQNLIIHRDIKPANVLVAADGTPRLLDFGIAKLLTPGVGGEAAPTVAGVQLMTPEYASPEQVRGEPVTTATDVYSLGVLLYELLTGRRPYRITSRAPAEIARVVCESTPARPSAAVTSPEQPAAGDEITREAGSTAAAPTHGMRPITVDADRLRRRLAGDLDTIVLKALSKEPSRRYASAEQFAEDVRRHLAGLPVMARRDTLGYRTAKFLRRNRAMVAAGVLVFLALVAGIIGTASQARIARAERQRAEQRFDDVRKLANAALFELHDAIRDLPGSTPARQLLVTKALEYLDKLAREAGDRPDLQRELAAAYLKVGDVQGRPLNPNLGDTAGALTSYRRAAALYEGLGNDVGDTPGLQREQGLAYMRLADILTATGDTAGALSYARRGVALQTQAAEAPGASADARREMAASRSRMADLLSATGRVTDALDERRRVLALMEAIAAEAPDDPANLRQLGVAHHKLGNTLGNPNAPNVGDHAAALDHMNRSAAVFRRALELYPDNATFKRNLAVANSNAADVLTALGRHDEAFARHQESIAGFEALAAADPSNVAARLDAALGFSKTGEIQLNRGNLREARRAFEQALATHQTLVTADPGNDALKGELAADHNRLATVEAKLGRRSAALEHHDQAVALSRTLAAANPGDAELRMALALALTGRGEAYALFAKATNQSPMRQSDLAAAERDYGEAVERLEAMEREGAIGGTDRQTLESARAELTRIRGARAGRAATTASARVRPPSS